MAAEPDQPQLERLLAAADRYDSLADTAELMGDDPGADRFHAEAARCRMVAFQLLDE